MVPEGWADATLGDLVKLQRGHDLPAHSRALGDIEVIGGGGPNGFHNEAKAPAPGIVIGRSGSGIGNAWWSDKPFWPLNTGMYVTDFLGNDPRFCFLWLDWIDFTSHNSGGAQPSLNRNFIYPIPLPIPPLSEQRKIAEILSTWDRAIETSEALLATARTQKRALMQTLLTGKRRFPEFKGQEWREVRLGSLCTPKQWPTISQKDMTQDGFPVFGANGFIGFYPEFNHAEATIVVTCRGATCGNVSRTPPRTYITGNAMSLDDSDPTQVDDGFLYQLLLKRGFDDIISGSAQPQIIGKDIRSVKISIPSISEQQAISVVLHDADLEIDGLDQQTKKLHTEKKALMQQLLTGKRRVRVETADAV
jgi:type I restriction enzyme S subunit